ISSIPVPENTSTNDGGASAVSISTIFSSSLPSRSRRRRFSRVALSAGASGGATAGASELVMLAGPVARDVADLGELRRLHLDEGRAREPRQPARDLRLAHARGADQHDVLGSDLV